MKRIYKVVLLFLIIQTPQTLADTQNVTIELGDELVYVPVPEKFYEITQSSPDTKRLLEAVTPQDSRLLAAFVSQPDYDRIMKGESAKFERFMVLQVSRKLEPIKVSNALFSKLSAQVKQDQNSLAEQTKEEIAPLLNDSSEKLSEEYGMPLKLEVDEIVPLGVFMEKANAIGFTLLQRNQASSTVSIEYLTIGGTAIINVKGKVFRAHINSDYKTPRDAEWIRATLNKWVDEMLAMNLHHKSSDHIPDSGFILKRSDWNSVLEEAIRGGKGAIVLGLIAGLVVLVKLFRRKK